MAAPELYSDSINAWSLETFPNFEFVLDAGNRGQTALYFDYTKGDETSITITFQVPFGSDWLDCLKESDQSVLSYTFSATKAGRIALPLELLSTEDVLKVCVAVTGGTSGGMGALTIGAKR